MKRARPWDRSTSKKREGGSNKNPTRSGVDRKLSPSFVEIRGTKFYSDRFYLNEYDEEPSSSCHCKRPPMFSRSALVESLSLNAVIFATYNLEIEALVEEFPSIFKEGRVPCIVLHGKKGLTKQSLEQQLAQRQKGLDEPASAGLTDDDDSVLGITLNDDISSTAREKQLAEHVVFSEIKSTWLEHIPASFNEVVCEDTGCLRREIIDRRLMKRGVHHPKYMILLEESGSIVVVVSTLNLTKGKRSIDGSWIQRFPPVPTGSKQKNLPVHGSIGSELAQMLQYQTLATAPDQMTVYSFAKRYMGWNSIFDISTNYDYQEACVHLVVTVPGDYRCTTFGQQRLSELTRKLPYPLSSEKDRLIIQPTSIGAEWKDGGVINLVRSYLHLNAEYRDTLRRLDIVWPTAHFIRSAGQRRSDADPTFSPKRKGARKVSNEDEMKGFIFLSSDTFNRIDVDCLSRMIMYEPCESQQTIISPHFKSIVRLYEGSDYRLRKEYGFPKCQELFSWFLLTSACLSKGAQGDRDHDCVSYANFELGVLFSSRHGGDRCSNSRVYCLKPQRCVCSSHSPLVADMIPLPVPYCFRAPRYMENNEEAVFCETPFFHEITPETATCGNMQLTPYGQALCRATLEKIR